MESLDSSLFLWLLAFIAIAATLYSSVGHGGASGRLRQLLGVVLVIAAIKMFITA